MRKYVVLIIWVMCSAFAKAQLESSYWYFGVNAGVRFSNGVAIPIDDGQLLTLEGCATISDSNGDLLFYTDGSLVFNRNHTLMPNGTDLKGNSSSTSSAIIVPIPQNQNRYYIFTVDTDDSNYSNAEGLHYSIVDLSLDNGNGDVDIFEKNVNLLPVTSEKLTAVRNRDNSGYWVLTHFEDQFYAYEITAAGINVAPVVSQVAPFIELVNAPFTNMDVAAMRGYIKLNADGDRLVAAHFSNNSAADFNGITNVTLARGVAYANGGELYLYDFNNATGVVSNPQPLMIKSEGASLYGVEFSANGAYLYAEADFMTPSSTQLFTLDDAHVYQFDLNAVDIAASRVSIYQSASLPLRGALQLGLDNRIYHAVLDETALRTINSPSLAGLNADYTVGSFPLSTGRRSQYGLPIFIQSFISNVQLQGDNHCLGTSQTFTVNADQEILNITWDFDDPDSGASNTSNLISPTHVFSNPGIYEVTAIVETTIGVKTVHLIIEVYSQVNISNSPSDLLLCNEGFNQATFDLSEVLNGITDDPLSRVSLHRNLEDANDALNPINSTAPFVNEENPQRLYIRVANDNCFLTTDFLIEVENCEIEIFNVLTPNEDGKNDTFHISGLRNIYLDYQLSIFNRYGQQVWEGNNNTTEWNGVSNMGLGHNNEKLPSGTYFYILDLKDGKTPPYSGYVYLH